MSFVVDVALSFAFTLLSSWIFPKTQQKSQDSIPNGDFGSPLYWAWGTTIVPGTLMYVLDPSLNDRVQLDKYNWSDPTESSSYAHFLMVNPVNPSVKAIRVNGAIVATGLADLPLDKDLLTQCGTTSDSIIGGSGIRFDQFDYRFYDGTQTTPDNIFTRQGHNDLIYNQMSYIMVTAALRKFFGGRGSALTLYIQNSVQTNSTPLAYAGIANTYTNLKINNNDAEVVTVPNGWLFKLNLAAFNGVNSISSNAFLSYFTFIQGTGSETLVAITPNASVAIVTNPPSSNLPGTPGNFSANPISFINVASIPVVFTNNVLVASKFSSVRSVAISPQLSPFYSDSGVIKNSANTIVANIGFNEYVVGWDNKMYEFTGSFHFPNTTLNTNNPIGYTDLVTIITDLLAEKNLTATFKPGFNESVIGFSTRAQDISQDIINLLTVYNKTVYEDKNNNLIFDVYPDQITANVAIEIPINAHLSFPDSEISPKFNLPDAVNFGFRDISRQFDSNSVRVGGSDNNIRDFSLEISFEPSDAQYRAWVVRNRLRGTYITGTLHLIPYYNIIEPNDVLKILPLTPNDESLYILVTRVEVGADLSVRIQYVNWVAPITYQAFQQSTLSQTYNPGLLNSSLFFLIDTEPRSNRIGLTTYTDVSNPITSGGETIVVPAISNLYGTVANVLPDKIVVNLASSSMSLTIDTDYYIGGSWVSCGTAVNTVNSTFELSNCVFGKYGSKDDVQIGDKIYGLAETNTFNNTYISYSATRNAQTISVTPETKKRIHEPTLAVFKVNAGRIYLSRKVLGFVDDGNLGFIPLSLSSITFRITNLNTLLTYDYFIAANVSSLESSFTAYTSGDQLKAETLSSITGLLISNCPTSFTTAI